MSILLQALKKSESQRELGSVPTLQTNTELLTATDQDLPIWVPALLVLFAALLMSWLGLVQYRVPEGLLVPGLVQQDEAQYQALGQTPVETPSASESSTAASGVQTAPSQSSILPRLTEAATARSEQQQKEQAQRGLGREIRDYTAEEEPPGKAVASTPTRDNAVRQSELAKVELERSQASTMLPQQSASQDQGLNPADAYEPDIISYWQVPEKMREGLPNLRISVLVFAEQPESRFVLLNGERLSEGEELPNGLLLEEIRRDRAIFSYRNYRFYLKS